MKTKTMCTRFLSVAVAVCAVLGLASPASADPTHKWKTPTSPNLSWSDPANWVTWLDVPSATVPGNDDWPYFQLSHTQANSGTIIMDKNYSGSGGNPALSQMRIDGAERVSIQSHFKLTHYNGLWLENSTPVQGAIVSVPNGGTLEGNVRLCNGNNNPLPTLEFTGGNWQSGTLVIQNNSNYQGGIIKVSTPSGTLTPTSVAVLAASNLTLAQRPCFDFVLANTGVAPITFTSSDPLQFTGSATGTNPFRLTVNMAAYTGGAVSIPLIKYGVGVTDTDRMFASGNISITGNPGGWTVTQSDSGVTLDPPAAPSTTPGTLIYGK